MKVAFIVRATLFTSIGGDTIQVMNTAKYLERMGVSIDIKLTTERIAYKTYDLLHFFNIIRPADILYHIRKAGRPFVVSTIFVQYEESDVHHRNGLARRLFSSFPSGLKEYIKTLGRYVVSKEKIMSKEYIWLGQNKSIRKIIDNAACLLPNSDSEYERLKNTYHFDRPFQRVPNGVDPEIFNFTAEAIQKDPNTIICVARIERIKNQLNLIKAMRNTRFTLYLIGDSAIHQKKYYEECRKLATANIHFINRLSQPELVHFYRKAKVHVLPSWFETTGLSSLEAAAMGCNLVISEKGDVREYFGDYAFYCDPAVPETIYDSIEQASMAEQDMLLQQKIFSDYTWNKAALKTLEAYKRVLKV